MKLILIHLRIMAPAVTLFATLMLFPGTVRAQAPTAKDVMKSGPSNGKTEAPKDQTAPSPKPIPVPHDAYNRGVPRTSVVGFLEATNSAEYETASRYLDLRALPSGMTVGQGPELARKLKVVLDRGLWIDLDLLSTGPKGHADDGLPSNLDYVGSIETDGRKFDILLQQVPREDGVLIWQFSSKTVANIPPLYQAFGYGWFGEQLAPRLPAAEFLGLQLWQWIFLFILALPAYVVALISTWFVSSIIQRRHTEFSFRIARFVTGPLRFLIMLLFLRAWFDLIHPSMRARAIARGQTLLIIVMVWICIRIVDLVRDYMSARLIRRNATGAVTLLQPISNAVKVLIVIVATLVWVDNLGFKVTTLLAGLGLGGLAVALAAQKSIENFIACLTLYSSAPVRAGDLCRYGDKLGVVEQIGLRSTSIRTLDRTTIHVPNSAFAEMQLENFASREKIWFHPILRLRMNTSPDQIRYILIEIRKLLYGHPKVDADPARIRFIGFAESSLELEVFAYILTADYGEYLEIAEDLNLRIMGIVEDAGSAMAIPAQTIFMEERKSFNREAAEAAEAKVKEWRETNSVYLPRFPDKVIQELRGTIDYPPKGSAPSV